MLHRHCSSILTLKYAIRKLQENRVGLELIETRHLSVYADDVNFLGESKNAIIEDRETILGASRDVGLEINAEKQRLTEL